MNMQHVREASLRSLAMLVDMAMDERSSSETLTPEAILQAEVRRPIEQLVEDGWLSASDRTEARLNGAAGIETLGDLLVAPRPPVVLLAGAKAFWKHAREQAEDTNVAAVVTGLYYLCAVLALARCGERISSLHDDALRDGLHWVRTRPWLNAELSGLTDALLASEPWPEPGSTG